MSGLEGPAFGLGMRAAQAAKKKWNETTEFDRLCAALAARFEESSSLGRYDFARFAEDDQFSAVLSEALSPPHEFNRDALAQAIAPLVGALDEETPAEKFALMVADAIKDEMQFAKTGDSLVRLKADELRQAVEASTTAQPSGGVDASWVPARARGAFANLTSNSSAEAQALTRSLSGEDLRAALPGLVGEPPRWLGDGSPQLWAAVARLAEVTGCWEAARRAREEEAERPGADRTKALMFAATAAEFADDIAAADLLRNRARSINSTHPLVRLLDLQAMEEPSERLSALEELVGVDGDRDIQALLHAQLALSRLQLGDAEGAQAAAAEAEAIAPGHFAAREARLSVLLSRNRSRREAGEATERTELLVAAEGYRRLCEDLRESHRFAESGGMLQRVAEVQTLADRPDLARITLRDAREEELDTDEVPLALAEMALNAGDPELAEQLLSRYTGDDPAAELMHAHAAIRTPERRQEGVAVLDIKVAEGNFEASVMRLMASVPSRGEVPWSVDAEQVVAGQRPALAASLKADWHTAAGRPLEASRVLAAHTDDPRVAEELMAQLAEQGKFGQAAGPARALLRGRPSLDTQVVAARVLIRAGAEAEAEAVLRRVLEHEDALPNEREAALGELVDQLLRQGRLADARSLSEPAAREGNASAKWVIAYTFAREGRFDEARAVIEGLEPRGRSDAELAANVHFATDSPADALNAILAVAASLDEPSEQVELRATLALMQCDEADISSELIERAGPSQFVERFPESTALFAADVASTDELVSLVREQARVRAEAAAAAQELVLVRGDAPIGALAIAVGLGLAETWTRLDELPLAYPDEDVAEDAANAAEAAGEPVVIETGALHSLHLLAEEVVQRAMAEYPLSAVPFAVVDDLIRATALDPAAGTDVVRQVHWDQERGDIIPVELPAESARAPYRAAQHMQRLAAQLQTPYQETSGEHGSTSGVANVYTECIAVAEKLGSAVYTDDRFLRRLLRSRGIRCFGSLGMLEHLRASGVITDDDYHDSLNRLRSEAAGAPNDT